MGALAYLIDPTIDLWYHGTMVQRYIGTWSEVCPFGTRFGPMVQVQSLSQTSYGRGWLLETDHSYAIGSQSMYYTQSTTGIFSLSLGTPFAGLLDVPSLNYDYSLNT